MKTKKLTLCFLVLGIMLVSLGMASAVSSIIFTNPVNGTNVSGTLAVTWTNTENTAGLWLQYKKTGNCSETTGWAAASVTQFPGENPTTYSWVTTAGVSDGQYCLRIQEGSTTHNTTGIFIVDNTKPLGVIVQTGSLIIGNILTFNANTSTDSGSGIKNYSWDFGDGSEDSIEVTVNHTYSTAGIYNVVLTVTDYAGNSNTTTLSLNLADITYETTQIAMEAGIRGIKDLNQSFNTNLSGVTCSFVGSSSLTGIIKISNYGNNCVISLQNVSYEKRGVYNLSVKTSNNTNTKYFKLGITIYSWIIPLTTGWNLISIPMIPNDINGNTNTSIKNVFGDIIRNITYESGAYTIFSYQYNGDENEWYKAKPLSGRTGFSSTGNLDYIVPGYAYWIKMDASDTLRGIGSISPDQGQIPPIVKVVDGWNLIGHYGINSLGMAISVALSSLKLGSTEYYDSVITNSSGKLFPYEGYWMAAKFLPNGVASYTPSQNATNYILGI